MTNSIDNHSFIQQKFIVDIDYDVFFTKDVFDLGNPLLEKVVRLKTSNNSSLICFIDEGVILNRPQLQNQIQTYFENTAEVKTSITTIVIKGGEQCKNDLDLLSSIYHHILMSGIDRHSCILAIGGGAVLDLVGYAAATAHRGIRLIRLPSTVLAQNDSGVGVKNGINLFNRENFIGTFSAPDSVVCDFSFLSTLNERDKRAGMAEAIKVSLIRDSDFFSWLEENASDLADFKLDAVAYSIKHCAKLHAIQISNGGDPFEKGSNRPLDYGHWIAHKIEDMSGYEIRHGEAVAIGILVDARYSYEIGYITEVALLRIQKLLLQLGFQLWDSVINKVNDKNELVVFDGLEEFREHLGGELSVTLLKDIGIGVEVHEIDHNIMKRSIAWVKKESELY